MTGRLAFVALAAGGAFLGAYALGNTRESSDAGPASLAAATVVAPGKSAPVSRSVPVPATARLPGLRDAPAAPARRRARVVIRRAPAAAPARAPAPAAPALPPRPAPKPDTGTPFFNAE